MLRNEIYTNAITLRDDLLVQNIEEEETSTTGISTLCEKCEMHTRIFKIDTLHLQSPAKIHSTEGD